MKQKLTMMLCALALFVTVPAFALDQQFAPEELSAEEISRIERYLQELKTAQARFVHTGHDGTQLVGTFYLNRPGRLRFEYDPPLEDFVVADGAFIYFYDAELGEQSNAPISTTLADFFLRKDLQLSGDLKVEESKRAGGYMQVKVTQANEPEAGSLTFAFTEDPFVLKKWRVVDPQGLITEVELFYLKTGMKLESDLFVYIDPKKTQDKTEYQYNE